MDAHELLKTRRTIRKFDQKPVSRETIRELVDLARYAPSGGNRQDWKIVAVDDPDRRDQVFDTLAWLPQTGAPGEGERPTAYLVIISDQQDAVADCASLATYSALAAHSLGLASCWFGSIRRTELAEDLNIPDEFSIEFVLALGYPAETAETVDASEDTTVSVADGVIQIPKLEVDSILHHNTFGG
ncbi:MAG: nitroreductase family protein [Planctomycetota bacterium]